MPDPTDVISTSLKSKFLTVKLPVCEFSGVSILYVVPEDSGDGSDPVEEKFINIPVAVSYTHLTLPTNREV